MSDPRFDVGLLDISTPRGSSASPVSRSGAGRTGTPTAGRCCSVPAAPGRAQVTFIAMAEAHVLEALSRPGCVRPESGRR